MGTLRDAAIHLKGPHFLEREVGAPWEGSEDVVGCGGGSRGAGTHTRAHPGEVTTEFIYMECLSTCCSSAAAEGMGLGHSSDIFPSSRNPGSVCSSSRDLYRFCRPSTG